MKSPVKGLFNEKDEKPTSLGIRTKPPVKSHDRPPSAKARGNTLRDPIDFKKPGGRQGEPRVPPADNQKIPASSQTLREAIARAKSARRSNVNSSSFVPRSVEDEVVNVGSDADPSTFGLLDSGHVNILKKRTNNAKSDGKLNIAALCLTDIPVEVLKMYDHDASTEGGSNWYEEVDVTRLNAADNELKSLPEELFPPDVSRTSDSEEGNQGIFAGLEAIDLHGNQLSSLPAGFSRLDRLVTLNLSRNKLDAPALAVISHVKTIKELRLAENGLSGSLPEAISGLDDLELLDLHGNQLTEVPATLGKLSKLRSLDVSGNRLSSLPLEAIFDLPLTEILASRNRLSGPFLPSSIPAVPTLQKLDVSNNALTALTDGQVDLPKLHTLQISFNRISALPDMSSWYDLVTLNAEENKISEIPPGFTSLKNIKHVDFNFNSLLQLDHGIGDMDGILSFRITNNPIRERLLLRMNVQDLKAELRLRSPRSQVQDGQHSDDAGSLTSFSRSPSGDWSSLTNGDASSRFSMISPVPGMSPIERVGIARVSRTQSAWNVTGETLDVSNAKLRAIEPQSLAVVANAGVKTFNASRNQIQSIPPSLDILGMTLATLDLTNNKLGKATNGAYITEKLSLPNLQTLNLTSNALTSLDPLVDHLSAPKLSTMILLFNRLTALPDMCTTYPQLTKLLASNNAIEALDVTSVKGLQVLDLSSNELAHLPPKLGLLQGQLRTLMVSGNKFKVPSWGVLEKGTEEILTWCRSKIAEGESMTL